MFKKLRQSQKGFAHLQLIILAAILIVGIGAVGSYVVFKSRAESSSTNNSNSLKSVSSLYGCKFNNLPVLREGDHGPCVKLAQWALNIDENAGLAIDGQFGPATYKAVIKFQKAYHLTVDGVIGPKTWAMLLASMQD